MSHWDDHGRRDAPQLGPRELRAARPSLSALFVSGYVASKDVPIERLVSKPFTADALHRKIEEVLDLSDGGRKLA